MNNKELLKQIKEIFQSTEPYYSDVLNIDSDFDYDKIINSWHYFSKINKTYLNKYEKTDNNTLSVENTSKIKYYFNKHDILEKLLENHIVSDDQHIIIFYIKGNDNILIFMKNKDNYHFFEMNVKQIRFSFNKSLKEHERNVNLLCILGYNIDQL
jgi:hypothetical protein